MITSIYLYIPLFVQSSSLNIEINYETIVSGFLMVVFIVSLTICIDKNTKEKGNKDETI
jgi:hypothetical protein